MRLGARRGSASPGTGRPSSRTSCSSWATTSASCSRRCYHRGLMVGETPNIDRIAQEGALLHDLLRRAELHGGAYGVLHRHASDPCGHDHAPAAWRHELAAARDTVAGTLPARPRLQHRRVRQEPPRRQDRLAADRARLPGVLGLPVSPRRDAGRELPGHQQVAAEQTVVPPCKNTPVPGLSDPPGAVDPRTTSA